MDEAGRGPLAGPVVVAAAQLPPKFKCIGIRDSKMLTREQRDDLFLRIVAEANYAIVVVPPGDVDRFNILQATLMGMAEALRQLGPEVESALVDGNRRPVDPPCPIQTVIGGDDRHAAIAAASILAKVTRDRLMIEAADLYPGYGFESHYGYARPSHIEAIHRLGPCEIHRRSFEPIKTLVNQPQLF